MKNAVCLAAFWLPLCLFSASPPHRTFLDNSSLAEVRQQAADEGKLYFIHFAAKWCMPCQWMEQHTFNEAALARYLEANYLALRIDVDEAEGRALQQQYQARVLPTLLVFSSRGQLLGRQEGALDAEDLLEYLQAYDRPANRAPQLTAASEESILSAPRPILSLSRPALVPDVALSSPLPRATPVAGLPAPAAKAHAPTSFFSIQAGLFTSYENAIREGAKLERFAGQSVRLNADASTGQTVYRIYLGRFNERAQALDYLQQLEARGINGFIKEVSD